MSLSRLIAPRSAPVGILGIGTALPPFSAKQMELLDVLHPTLEPGSARERLAQRIYRNSRIDERRFCIPHPGSDDPRNLYRTPEPTTAQRMDTYRNAVPGLATEAAERALKHARVQPDEVSHLIVVSCTGICIPGPDVEIAARLSLPPSIERTVVGFMGCSGAFHGLRVARRAAVDSPRARVLLVCVELCSLHRRPSPDVESIVANSLFADGAAAVVLGASDAPALVELGESASHLEVGARDALTWRVQDDGFELHLSRAIPAIVVGGVASFVAQLLTPDEAVAELEWLVHPGGAAILSAVERALELPGSALASSWEVLRRFGNTSSAAILYVLAEALPRLDAGASGVMLGFGPGLAFEAVRFRRGSRGF